MLTSVQFVVFIFFLILNNELYVLFQNKKKEIHKEKMIIVEFQLFFLDMMMNVNLHSNREGELFFSAYSKDQ